MTRQKETQFKKDEDRESYTKTISLNVTPTQHQRLKQVPTRVWKNALREVIDRLIKGEE